MYLTHEVNAGAADSCIRTIQVSEGGSTHTLLAGTRTGTECVNSQGGYHGRANEEWILVVLE